MHTPSTVAEKKRELTIRLQVLYDPREAGNIADILFEDRLGFPPGQDAALFPAHLEATLREAEQRLLQSEPVQYVCGLAYFYGFPFRVNPAVLIPRPETEELVYKALDFLSAFPAGSNHDISVLDIGTGSGCIPITLAKKRPDIKFTAIDKSAQALEIARENADRLNARVDFRRIDFLDEASWKDMGSFHLIISNPPYIPRRERHLVPDNVQRYEPLIALFVSDEDPLIFYRKMADFSRDHLRVGGALLLEVNQYLANEVVELFAAYPHLREVTLWQDMSGNDRMVFARK